jgi:hypothetical protein
MPFWGKSKSEEKQSLLSRSDRKDKAKEESSFSSTSKKFEAEAKRASDRAKYLG